MNISSNSQSAVGAGGVVPALVIAHSRLRVARVRVSVALAPLAVGEVPEAGLATLVALTLAVGVGPALALAWVA